MRKLVYSINVIANEVKQSTIAAVHWIATRFALAMTIMMISNSGFAAAPVEKKLNVVTTTTDLAWLAREIGGDAVSVTSLLKGVENPHYADANPNYIRLASRADMVLLVGLELEIGWMPKVLQRSGNAAVQPGGKGYVEVGSGVSVLEKPAAPVDRSMGDVHPHGNPHFWLSPKAMKEAAELVAKKLAEVDVKNPARAALYSIRAKAFAKKMDQLMEQLEQKMNDIKAQIKLLEYHKEFLYLLDAFSLSSLGSLEEKPGVTASAARIAQVAKMAKESKVHLLLASNYAPRKQLDRFKELSGIDYAVVMTSLQLKGPMQDYGALLNFIIDKIIASVPENVSKISPLEKGGLRGI